MKVLDQNGIGTDSQVIAAIQRAIALKKTYNIRVINLSLGRPVRESYKTDPLCQAVEQAWKAGIVVVVAAGNEGRNNSVGTEGYATITAPGNDPYVITVGAMKTLGTASRADDQIASYSSKGPTLLDHIVKPDLVAPGNRTIAVRSAGARLALNYPVNQVPRSYYATANLEWFADYVKLSGTSMATPMVSGAVAILLQKTPSLTPDQVKARLMKTASKVFPVSTTASDPVTGEVFTSQYDIFTVGAGYLDILAALNNTDVASGAALSPAAVYNASTGTVSLVNGSSVIWGTSVIWGNHVVWGTSVVWGSNVVWGTNVIWGTSGTQGSSVIWGASVVWGTGQPTSEAIGVAVNGEN